MKLSQDRRLPLWLLGLLLFAAGETLAVLNCIENLIGGERPTRLIAHLATAGRKM